jgi:hypothetical protein
LNEAEAADAYACAFSGIDGLSFKPLNEDDAGDGVLTNRAKLVTQEPFWSSGQ